MTTAYILINCVLGKEEITVNKLVQMSDNIVECRATYGIHDIFVKVKADTISELDAIILLIRKVPDLTSVATALVISEIGGKDQC